jgi:hypothetical protein
MSIASWFGFFRGAALLVAVIAGVICVGAGWRAGLIGSAVIALFYFAIADALYIARLAAYVELAGSDTAQGTTSPQPPQPESPSVTALPETETETEHSGLS